jgi:N-acetyl-D-muramate 6-phosphate phosphatase
MNLPIKTTILFDLDGTLLDTAPDMIGALNTLRKEQSLPALPSETLRGSVSHGSAAMISAGFNLTPDDETFTLLQQRFLEIYQNNIAVETRLFPGMETVIDTLDQKKIAWGVVTNKPSWLTEPLLQTLNLAQRCACIISGDSLPEKKPDPKPLLHGCEIAGGQARQSLYIGDAQRDIEAGNRAGMQTMLANWGYIGEQDCPDDWQADHIIQDPLEILDWLYANTH